MSLATRCPTCGTVFRVVHDQLLVSQGWVRCGRCSGVFNATDDLLDMATGAPVHLPPPAAAPRGSTQPPLAQLDEVQPEAMADGAGPWVKAEAEAANPPPPPPPPPPSISQGPAPDDDMAPAPGLLLRAPSIDDTPAAAQDAPAAHLGTHLAAHLGAHADAQEPSPGGLSVTLADPAHASAPALAAMAAFPQEAPPAPEAQPEFVRAAERHAAWRRPPVRAGAVLGALALAALAAAQAALLWRDALAAQHPDAAPALQALCRLAGCQVQPLHRIGQLSVDASALSRLDGVPADDPAAAQYRLSLSLRNRADIPLAVPAVELSLTDAAGRLVLRRVLRLAELGAAQPVLAPGQELPLQALLATGGQSVDGYTVELFYP